MPFQPRQHVLRSGLQLQLQLQPPPPAPARATEAPLTFTECLDPNSCSSGPPDWASRPADSPSAASVGWSNTPGQLKPC